MAGTPKYNYAVAENGGEFLIIRQRGGEGLWEVVTSMEDKDRAVGMVEDLNLAQRMRPGQVEPGQELVQRD